MFGKRNKLTFFHKWPLRLVAILIPIAQFQIFYLSKRHLPPNDLAKDSVLDLPLTTRVVKQETRMKPFETVLMEPGDTNRTKPVDERRVGQKSTPDKASGKRSVQQKPLQKSVQQKAPPKPVEKNAVQQKPLNNKTAEKPAKQKTPPKPEEKKVAKPKSTVLERLLAMRNQTLTGGAFVHIGKTGGSTLSLLLRNGCHSFMNHPCRNVTMETPASRLVESYYHVPDFRLLYKSEHDFYILTVRDPYDRTVSSFCHEHLANRWKRNETIDNREKQRRKIEMAYECFPTLEAFALYLQGNASDFHYPYDAGTVHPESCQDLARAALHSRVRIYNHFFFGYVRMKSFLPPNASYYVVRQESLWEDWETINRQLRQQLPPHEQKLEYEARPSNEDLAHQRNATILELQLKLPVTRTLSPVGASALCQALVLEYQAYFWFLQQAHNINANDLIYSINRANDRCGKYLNIQALARSAA